MQLAQYSHARLYFVAYAFHVCENDQGSFCVSVLCHQNKSLTKEGNIQRGVILQKSRAKRVDTCEHEVSPFRRLY